MTYFHCFLYHRCNYIVIIFVFTHRSHTEMEYIFINCSRRSQIKWISFVHNNILIQVHNYSLQYLYSNKTNDEFHGQDNINLHKHVNTCVSGKIPSLTIFVNSLQVPNARRSVISPLSTTIIPRQLDRRWRLIQLCKLAPMNRYCSINMLCI